MSDNCGNTKKDAMDFPPLLWQVLKSVASVQKLRGRTLSKNKEKTVREFLLQIKSYEHIRSTLRQYDSNFKKDI